MARSIDLLPITPEIAARGSRSSLKTWRFKVATKTTFHKGAQRYVSTPPKQWRGVRVALNDLDRALRGELKLEEDEA